MGNQRGVNSSARSGDETEHRFGDGSVIFLRMQMSSKGGRFKEKLQIRIAGVDWVDVKGWVSGDFHLGPMAKALEVLDTCITAEEGLRVLAK